MIYGKCSGCGRVIEWRADESIEGKHVLICYGGGYYCCNDECYKKARLGK